MFDLNKVIRDNVRQLQPYSSARDEYLEEEGIFLDANENPYGDFNRYPDPYQRALKGELATWRHVQEDQVFIGNGSDEVIDLLFRISCDPDRDKVLIMPPTYGIYEVAAAINGVDVLSCPLDDRFQIDLGELLPFLDDPTIKMLFICSPNNPTGNLLSRTSIEFILARFKGLVIIDEAYVDFAGQQSWVRQIQRYPNLLVLQTMSKAWGLAGARVGMAYGSSEIIAYLNKVKPAYNVSTPSQELALKKLRYKKGYQEEIQLILQERGRLEQQLSSLSIIEEVYPSDSNFILIKVAEPDRLYFQLIDQGIVTRNRNRLLSGCLRISVGTVEENTALIKAIENINK
jgi:histidinol-phosphate aminotransferase